MSRASDAVERLLAVMARLRGPDGCPWDREQTLSTLRPYVLEETYEVLEAIDAGDPAAHREELGDLLLQIVFQARIAEEEGRFDFAGVADAISEKLLSRHPHVFGPGATSPDSRPDPAGSTVRDSDGVLRQWAALKKRENEAKGRGKSVLEGVPRELPALARAERLTEKASRVGFDWPDAAGARAKVAEELEEVDEAIAGGDRARIEDELGDLLFAVANLARKLGIAPEEALRGTLAKFVARFEHVETELARRGVPHGGASLAEMDRLWEEAKALPARTPKSS
ncbi:MAG TPA: nucleoside triphosphate pyrophosphohydrolase [Anaeromyxobacteraceae bacterium]|nr:nucleoside triphosphate pyrophosphohydrolase [Anaeromyxobacteraceae bacterium]